MNVQIQPMKNEKYHHIIIVQVTLGGNFCHCDKDRQRCTAPYEKYKTDLRCFAEPRVNMSRHSSLSETEYIPQFLRKLKKISDEYKSLFDKCLYRNKLIAVFCGVVVLSGTIIIFLKIEERETLLHSFQAIRSFASLISGSSIAFGISILSKRPTTPEVAENYPDKNIIDRCVKTKLIGKLIDMCKELRKKKEILEHANFWQTTWAIIYSIITLILFGIDFFGFSSSKYQYSGVWIDCFLSLASIYFMCCVCVLYSILTFPPENIAKRNRLTLVLFVIPCVFFNGLVSDDAGKKKIFSEVKMHWRKRSGDWIKSVYYKEEEISDLLDGLDPDIFKLKIEEPYIIEEFCDELDLIRSDESTPLISANKSRAKPGFLETIEFKANQEVIKSYFNFGKALAEFLRNQEDPQEFEEIIQKFSPIKSHVEDTKKILEYYFNPPKEGQYYFNPPKEGLELSEFFKIHPQKKPLDEEIKISHGALKIYVIFDAVGKGKIDQIRKFSASTIGNFTKYDVFDIIKKANKPAN
jgi:hypothetical protein